MTITKDLPKYGHREFGVVVQTPGVMALNDTAFTINCLGRHYNNDWGDLDEHDYKCNVRALTKKNGDRIMSVFKKDDVTLWILSSGFGNDPSDPDACNTVLMLPSEY